MKIIFIGTVQFSFYTLNKLFELNATIAGIVTQKASSFNSDYADLTPLAEKHNVPIHYTENVNSLDSVSWIKSQNPDVIFCFGWSNLLKAEILNACPMGVVGYHPALLPLNRGRHPIIWALVLGLKETGSTFFFMDKGADSGPILNQKKIEIDDKDDARNLYEKIVSSSLLQIEEFLPALQNNTYTVSQQDQTKANYWRKRGKSDGVIDWRMSSKAIYNLVRALTKPYVGAHTEFDSKEIKIWKVEMINENPVNSEPGKILSIDDNSIYVKSADGIIRIVDHEFEILPKINTYLK
ncbi:MAG: methionyl-tRNA formyltransferase [Bacteroidota bacterium]|jgi:methionyl-tRNA formyltransferase|nr:methionyl-tRNA formyltransferase [Bacteroidota bacterium]